jgi:hypothetical protein
MCSFLHGAICLPITEAIPLEIQRSFQLTISLGQGKKILTFNYKKVTHLDKPESTSLHPPPTLLPKTKKEKKENFPQCYWEFQFGSSVLAFPQEKISSKI